MLKCIAIDDEPIALNIIESYCQQHGEIQLETFTSPQEGMNRIKEISPDIVFMDIEMTGYSGIELAKELPADSALIFTTAYANYALEGFDVDAVDFLHKPYFYERFCRAIQKAEQWQKMHNLLNIAESHHKQLMLNSYYKKVSIPVDSISYIESIYNYVKVHTTDGSSIISKTSLKSVEDQLSTDDFIRIHRSFLVARNRIAGFTSKEIALLGSGKMLPIGRKYTTQVMTQLGRKER